MSIVIKTGGIKLLTLALSSLMTPFTGSAIMGATAGIMSLFSSGLGRCLPDPASHRLERGGNRGRPEPD